MPRKRARHIVSSYVLTLLVTIALLVGWVVYILRSVSRINELAARLGGQGETFHWVVLSVGCALFALVILGLTLQLAHAVAARRYSRKQDEFVSNITHEMKSPLAAMKLHGQTLQHGGLSPNAAARSLELILRQIDHMGVLVDDVLESSRLVAQRASEDAGPIQLRDFFANYFDEVRAGVVARGVALSVRVETNARVRATAQKLHRVMTNLLDNAVRFSNDGGEVRCLVRDVDEKVRIEVEDDGVGIPRKELGKVFDRFHQVDAGVDARRRGTGLGLSIVAGLVEEMKGNVRAYSQDGRPGARLVIELPTIPVLGES